MTVMTQFFYVLYHYVQYTLYHTIFHLDWAHAKAYKSQDMRKNISAQVLKCSITSAEIQESRPQPCFCTSSNSHQHTSCRRDDFAGFQKPEPVVHCQSADQTNAENRRNRTFADQSCQVESSLYRKLTVMQRLMRIANACGATTDGAKSGSACLLPCLLHNSHTVT